jgi:hypothetical protein
LKTELDFEENIDKCFLEAAKVLDMADLPDGIDDEELEFISEARFHCGTCTVRTVMEVVWPAIEEYIDWLKQGGNNEEEQNGLVRSE